MQPRSSSPISPSEDNLQAPLQKESERDVPLSGPFAVNQEWSRYRHEEHQVWQLLFSIQEHQVATHAAKEWREGVAILGLQRERIPHLKTLSERLHATTGWQAAPISEPLPTSKLYLYLARRQFPCVVSLRSRRQSGSFYGSDIFHDTFGILPMLTHHRYAQAIENTARAWMNTQDPSLRQRIHRVHQHLSRYGVYCDNQIIKPFGSALLAQNNCWNLLLSTPDNTNLEPFSTDTVALHPLHGRALPHTLFALQSLDEITEAVAPICSLNLAIEDNL